MLTNQIRDKTIEDFGEQWTKFQSNSGYYGSKELFSDILNGLIDQLEFKNSRVADIGSGSGRIVLMLNDAGAKEILAVEPSEAMTVLKKNTASIADKITYLKVPGHKFYAENLDYVVSFGVLHHIPDPIPVLKACHSSLKPEGKIIIWLYGYEGNEFYLFFAGILRRITPHLPHILLSVFCWILVFPLLLYIKLCKFIPLPMRDYMAGHLGKLSLKVIHMTVYDQLNPQYAKYYKKQECIDLLKSAGFNKIQIKSRHGYSWTLIGEKK